MLKKILKHSERGQAIILIALAIVGLVAIVGLMVDGGIVLVHYARLKRGADSAAIAAASQFRKGFVSSDLEKAGIEFLGFNDSIAEVSVFTCDYPGTKQDKKLCAPEGQPQRKLVNVVAREYVQFGFMRVIGMEGTWISAASVGEAASIDMVLAIDTSSSMAYETTEGGDPLRSDPASGANAGDDPVACNNDPDRRCEPMGTVKDMALAFVDELFYPYDRVAVVASTGQETDGTATRLAYQVLGFADANQTENGIKEAIRALRVFQPVTCPLPLGDHTDHLGPCLYYDPQYIGQTCIPYQVGVLRNDGSGQRDYNPTSCGVSNFGGMLYMAAEQFADARPDSFWVVVSLIGGPANAAPFDNNPNQGYCPQNTWDLPHGSGFCRNENYNNRHLPILQNNVKTFPADYDAVDYAKDGADQVASPSTGSGATMYAICMGVYCREYPNTQDPDSAEKLAKYMALEAGGPQANHGLYFYSNDAAGLAGVFADIADNIFTRISK